MQQKDSTVLWRKSLALLSLLALLCVSAANASHIHNEATGSPAQQDCVLCVIGGQSPALLAHVPTAAAYLSTALCLPLAAEQHASTDYHHSGSPRAPPVPSYMLA